MKKHRLLKSGLLSAVVLTLGLALTGCGQSSSSGSSSDSNPSSVSAIQKNGTIKVAVFGDLPPYGWVDKNGQRQGYDIALAKQIGKDLNVKVKFVQVNANSRVDALKSNKVDLVLANFTVTSERKQVVDFAKPYMKVSIGVVSPKSNPVTSVDQLKGKALIVNKGTTAENYFTTEQKDVSLQKYDSKTEQFNALKNGRAAGLADDNSYLYAWSKDHPDFTVGIKTLGPDQFIAPAVKKGNKSLLNWTNKEITKLNNNGFFAQDYDKNLKPYFGSDVTAEDIIITK